MEFWFDNVTMRKSNYNIYSEGEVRIVSTKERTQESLELMIEDIKDQLHIVNGGAMKAKYYSLDKFDDIEELHTMVMKKTNFSVSELDAIVIELGKLRTK